MLHWFRRVLRRNVSGVADKAEERRMSSERGRGLWESLPPLSDSCCPLCGQEEERDGENSIHGEQLDTLHPVSLAVL